MSQKLNRSTRPLNARINISTFTVRLSWQSGFKENHNVSPCNKPLKRNLMWRNSRLLLQLPLKGKRARRGLGERGGALKGLGACAVS